MNGNRQGVWEGFYDNKILRYKENYKNGKLVNGISYDTLGIKYEYQKIRSFPTPSIGYDSFYENILRNLKYPKKAKKEKIEGKVIAEFYVDTNGNITNPRIIQSLGYGCDTAVLKIINDSEKWVPGKNRGQNTVIKVTFPLIFNLARH